MRARYVWLACGVALAGVLAALPWLTGQSWMQLADRAAGTAKSFAAQATSDGKAKGAGGDPKQKGPPPAVTVSQPISREIVEWDEYTARFEAVEAVDIRARVGGYLTEVHFKDGQDVKAGDLLFVIDPRPFERAVGLAAAELDQARVRVKNASLDVERGRPLLERSVISEKTFDDRENLVRDANSAVKVNEERLKNAELDLSFTRVTAPISGRIGRTNVTAGNFVTGGGNGTATSLLSIVSQDPIYVYFDINENNAIKYRRMKAEVTDGRALIGAQVELALPDEKGFPHRGTVDFVDNRIDQGTGTLRARGVIENKSGLFTPGMFARARLAGSPKYVATLLPDEAIATDQASRFVWTVADDGVPQRRGVKLGPLIDGLRLVREGLPTEEWVIVKGAQRVRPGQQVTPKREPLAVSDARPATTGSVSTVRTP